MSFCDLLRFFKGLVKIKKEKKRRKTAATSSSNRSGRLCERFCECEEAERMVLLFREEKQNRLKVEGDKNDFFHHWLASHCQTEQQDGMG